MIPRFADSIRAALVPGRISVSRRILKCQAHPSWVAQARSCQEASSGRFCPWAGEGILTAKNAKTAQGDHGFREMNSEAGRREEHF